MKTILYASFGLFLIIPSSSFAQSETLGLKQDSPNNAAYSQSNWKGCAEDNDCVIIGQDCFVDSVNEDFQNEAERDLDEKNDDTKCNDEMAKSDDPDAICTNSVCTVRY